MQKQNFENEFQPKKQNYIQILGNLLKQNQNHDVIKERVSKMMQKVETLTYSALVQTQDKYIKKLGMLTYDEDLFNFIGRLLHEKQGQLLEDHQNGTVVIKQIIKPSPEPEPEPDPEIVQEVQNVMKNVDLPLSLFKRNDNYWSIDNPRTKEAKEYLTKLRKKQERIKEQINKKRQEILKEKQQMRSKTIEVMRKQQIDQRKHLQQRIMKKINDLKKNDEDRKKSISQSVQFMKQRGVPLFKKIEKEFKEKVQIPTLQEKKKKLTELRQIMRSVPLDEIQSHRERYQKLKSQHQQKKIIDEPLNISFKSHFYDQIKSISASRFNEPQQNLSLYQKKLEYSRMVKENYKPSIDELKKEEIQSRIKLMNKRRARVNKTKKETKDSDDDSEEESEEQQQSESEPEESSQDSNEDSDEQKPKKDDQYEPSNKQRYQMGLNYLQVARKLAVKKAKQDLKSEGVNSTEKIEASSVNMTIDLGDPKSTKIGQQTIKQEQKKAKTPWVNKNDEQKKKDERIQYKDYLRERINGSHTIDLMDTSRIKKQIQKTLGDRSRAITRYQDKRRNIDIDSEILYHTNLQNKLRNIEQRAKNQEELLRYKRIHRSQKIKKQMAIDDAVVDTIKARLLMMNKTLDN